MKSALIASVIASALGVSATAQGSADCTREAMLVFDASGSMADVRDGRLALPRIVEARAALHRTLPVITSARNLGLVVFGPGAQDACSNIDLRLLPQPRAAAPILDVLDTLTPDGDTALTASVAVAADLLIERNKGGEVVLITDGRETCGGEPCILGERLAREGGITVHVIGFRVPLRDFQMQGAEGFPQSPVYSTANCLADHTGGTYSSTHTTQELEDALLETLGCALFSKRSGPQKKRQRG